MNGPVNMQTKNDYSSYCKFGCETMLKQLDAFEGQIDGVIESSDIEYLHRMRVASRRIRAALPLFQSCFPKNEYAKWRREIKKVTRLLSSARDLDVQLASIEQYLSSLNLRLRRRVLTYLSDITKNKEKPFNQPLLTV